MSQKLNFLVGVLAIGLTHSLSVDDEVVDDRVCVAMQDCLQRNVVKQSIWLWRTGGLWRSFHWTHRPLCGHTSSRYSIQGYSWVCDDILACPAVNFLFLMHCHWPHLQQASTSSTLSNTRGGLLVDTLLSVSAAAGSSDDIRLSTC